MNNENRWRSADGRFAARLVHLGAGWRWWAFEVKTGFDAEHGLSTGGYDTLGAAQSAVGRVGR